MLGRQVQQALRVYTTHGTFWVCVLLWFFWQVMELFLFILTGEALVLLMIVPINAVLGFEIGQTLAAQFAHPRARLLPEFARAHLIAAGGLVTAAVATVLLTACLLRVPVASAFGLSIVGLGLAILLPLNTGRAKYGSWLVLGMVVLVVWASGGPWFRILLTDPRFHAALGGIGVVAMVVAASRLVSLSEDSPDYASLAGGLDWDTQVDAPTDRQFRRQAREAAAISQKATLRDALLRMVFRWLPRPGRWRRIMLFQMAHGAPVLFLLPHQFAAFLLFWLMGDFLGFSNDSQFDKFLLCMWPMTAISISLHAWSNRVDHLARESLLPFARRDVVRELYLMNTFEMAVAAAGHCTVIIVALALFQRNLPTGFVSAWLALTITQHLIVYSLLFWLHSVRRSCVATAVTAILSFIVLPGATAVIVAETTIAASWRQGTVAMLVLAVIAVLASVGLHRLAVRVWCRIDFDGERLLPRERIPRKRFRTRGRYR